MFFNAYEMYQRMKLRQKEMEEKAQGAWKFEDLTKDSFIQRITKKWNKTFKSPSQQPNCCACNC